jgi:hypothetical protein
VLESVIRGIAVRTLRVKFQTEEKADFNISAVLLEDLSEKLNLTFFGSVYSCFARRDGSWADLVISQFSLIWPSGQTGLSSLLSSGWSSAGSPVIQPVFQRLTVIRGTSNNEDYDRRYLDI